MLTPKTVNDGFSTKIKKRIFMVIGANTANVKGPRFSEFRSRALLEVQLNLLEKFATKNSYIKRKLRFAT